MSRVASLSQFPRRLLTGLVRAYQLLLGNTLVPSCRFTPTCSQYAIESLQRHGAAAGTYLAARRIVRCQPWCAGGHDPVPEAPLSLFPFNISLTKKKSSS